MSTQLAWIILIFAILFEVCGTLCMKASESFTKVWPTTGLVVFYALSLILLTLTLKKIDVGIAYAVWAGLGTLLIAILGVIIFSEPVTWPRAVGVVMIAVGVAVLNMGKTM